MKRFDRVTSILLLLHTRSVVTAKFLAEEFEVSERTIYRDIRSLENAGIPIGAEAGVGYFLERTYRLPPVNFTFDEAATLLLTEKLVSKSLDPASVNDMKHALNKIRAVMPSQEKDTLSRLDQDTIVRASTDGLLSTNRIGAENTQGDPWLRECRTALTQHRVLEITYTTLQLATSTRQIEPIGLYYYQWHWHLIAWCQLRQSYRDFRLDRIVGLSISLERYSRHQHPSLSDYLAQQSEEDALLDVEILFSQEAAAFVQEQRYYFGFVQEEQMTNGIKMRFLTKMPDYMSRWLLQYLDGIQILKGEALRDAMKSHATLIYRHWIEH